MSAERCLIATWPCGCIGAVSMTAYLSAAEQARFLREHVEDGALVENVTMDEFRTRGGIVICKHDPQWGRTTPPAFGHCPRCHKRVKTKKDGGLRAHQDWGSTCSQEPYETRLEGIA